MENFKELLSDALSDPSEAWIYHFEKNEESNTNQKKGIFEVRKREDENNVYIWFRIYLYLSSYNVSTEKNRIELMTNMNQFYVQQQEII